MNQMIGHATVTNGAGYKIVHLSNTSCEGCRDVRRAFQCCPEGSLSGTWKLIPSSPLGMAYYAASTPPPPKAPSLAPTTASELTVAPITPPVEKKKVKDLLKRALKEVSGGGGNNAKLEEALKGGPVLVSLDPLYERQGLGILVIGPTIPDRVTTCRCPMYWLTCVTAHGR